MKLYFEKLCSNNLTKSAGHFRGPNLIRLVHLLVVFHFPKPSSQLANVCEPRQVASNHSFPDLQVAKVKSLSYSQSPADALFSLLVRTVLCTGALDDSRKQAPSESPYWVSTITPVPISQKPRRTLCCFLGRDILGAGISREPVPSYATWH